MFETLKKQQRIETFTAQNIMERVIRLLEINDVTYYVNYIFCLVLITSVFFCDFWYTFATLNIVYKNRINEK